MNTYRIIDTHGNPLGAIRKFMTAFWQHNDLEGMLVPFNNNAEKPHRMEFIDQAEHLAEINPFKPVMIENASRMIPSLLDQHQDARLGAVLRPCEIRALTEMVKHDSFYLNNLLTICVDCLKTIPTSEYQWRHDRKNAEDGLTQEVLQFARQGGIVAYRYRPACQMCFSPQAKGADVNIRILGLPVRSHILVHTESDAIAKCLDIEAITDSEASKELVEQHNQIVAKMDERHYHRMKLVVESLDEILPRDIDALSAQLETCSPCETCMNVCPICAVDRPQKDAEGHFKREDITRWMLSCAGCGMCEQACPSHLPLIPMFRQMQEELCQTWNYIPGMSVDQPLPLM